MNDITDVPGIQVGHWSDVTARTGCTVVLLPDAGAVTSVDVRGAAPGTRETDLLLPDDQVQVAHAILLTGGSAFGLAAADGVMAFLEERGSGGLQVQGLGVSRVPGHCGRPAFSHPRWGARVPSRASSRLRYTMYGRVR